MCVIPFLQAYFPYCQTFNLLRIARPGAWGLYELHTSGMGEVPGDSVTQWSVSWSHGPGSIETMSSCWRASSFLACQLFWKIPSFLKFNDIFYTVIGIVKQDWDYLPNKEFVLQSGLHCWYKACNYSLLKYEIININILFCISIILLVQSACKSHARFVGSHFVTNCFLLRAGSLWWTLHTLGLWFCIWISTCIWTSTEITLSR